MTKIKITDIPLGAIENNKNKDKKVKVASKIKLTAPLKEISSEYWDKVKVGNNWDREYSTPLPNTVKLPIMVDLSTSRYDKRFKTQELLNNFKKYADDEVDFYLWAGTNKNRPKIKDIPADYFGDTGSDKKDSNNWNKWHSVSYFPTEKKLTQFLREANKMFHNPDGYGKLKEKEAFEFLKSIIESKEIKSRVKFNPGDEITLGEWLKYRDNSNNNDQIELTEKEVIELGISNTIVQQPVVTQPTSPSSSTNYQQIKDDLTKWTDKFKGKTPEQVEKELNDLINNSGGKLPADLPLNWRDLVARIPFLEKANQDLSNDKKRVEKESKSRIDTLNNDLQNRDGTIDSLQTDLSQVRAENTHLKEYDLKKVNDKLSKWETTFKGQEAYEVERELNKPKLTKDQEDKINNYDDIKRKWEEWTKAFPPTEFSTPEKARIAYDAALHNQKPANHDQVLDDLNEWKSAFPNYKFPKKPEDIRKEYDKLATNQKPTDYEQFKSELEKWTNVFSGPEFKGQEPAQIRAIIEKYKDQLSLREKDLLFKYREDISRLEDNTLKVLKHVRKDSWTNKYKKEVDKIAETGLTLENVPACMQNLNAVMAICATEKALEWSKQIDGMSINDDNRATQVVEIAEFLPKIERIWKKVPVSPEKNNPFYLPIIEDKSTHIKQISDLITKWGIQKRILLGYDETENPQTQFETYIEQPNK